MRIDVSEIKTYRSCKRQWQLSSRNMYHLTPRSTPRAFVFGTIFHEALHSMYLGASLDKVMEQVRREASEDDTALFAMVPGYFENVLGPDLERFEVVDIEHSFDITPSNKNGEIILDAHGEPLHICGSIDMVVRERGTNTIYGFEHKTAKNFRAPEFLWMDEQPRVYSWALREYASQLNADFGGIYLNEVKKLLRKFDYRRTLCTYPEGDLENFMESFFNVCRACAHDVQSQGKFHAPEPSYFGCQMCDFKDVCQTYMYSDLNLETILYEFEEELTQREVDHLDEKAQRP